MSKTKFHRYGNKMYTTLLLDENTWRRIVALKVDYETNRDVVIRAISILEGKKCQ